MQRRPLFFTGSSHQSLGREICEKLQIPLGQMALRSFPDGEISVEVLEDVQGKDVFVLQSLALSPNYYLMELLVMIDAMKRSLAKTITAVVPYLSYCRQDKRNKPGMPITAKLIANLLSSAGIDHLVTCDLHSDQVEGFFEIPITHLRCQALLSESIRPLLGDNLLVVAPDIGSIKIAEAMAKELKTELAIIKKERRNAYEVEMVLIGNVSSKNVLIVDDLCSTAGTLVAAAKICQSHGAKSAVAAVTHGLFVEDALEKIAKSCLKGVLATNTISQAQAVLEAEKLKEISVAKLIAQAVQKLSS